MRRLLTTTAVAAGTLWFGPAAFAGPTINPSVCALTDINLTINGTTYNPSACIADIEIGQAPANPATETALMNSAPPIGFGTNFSFLAKSDSPANGGNTSGPALDGILFTLAASTFTANSGTYTVGWTDTNGPAADNLPISIDFEVLINGGSNGDAYKFTGVTLPAPPNNSGTGNFTITFFNPGGQFPNLSHMLLTGGDDVQINQQCTAGVICDPVPEPASLALFGVGLLGLGFFSAKRRYS